MIHRFIGAGEKSQKATEVSGAKPKKKKLIKFDPEPSPIKTK